MDLIKGEDLLVYARVGGGYQPIGCLSSNSWTENVEMIETTTRDSGGWRTYYPNVQGFSFSMSGFVYQISESNKISYTDLRSMKRTSQLIDFKITRPSGYDDYFQGYLTNLSEEAPVGELVTFSASVQGVGDPSNDLYVNMSKYSEYVDDEDGTIESYQCVTNFYKQII